MLVLKTLFIILIFSPVFCGLSIPQKIFFNLCPYGTFYSLGTDKCYIVRNKEVRRDIAERNCENMDGYLAVIESNSEQNFIKSIIQSYSYWIGPNDKKESRKYVNPDGSPVTYLNWGTSQPDDDITVNNQGCVCLYELYDHSWHDVECYLSRRYICQIHEPREGIVRQVTYRLKSNGLLEDSAGFDLYSTNHRLRCQILCLSFSACIGYLWNNITASNNCMLISPLLYSTVSVYQHGDMLYEAVER